MNNMNIQGLPMIRGTSYVDVPLGTRMVVLVKESFGGDTGSEFIHAADGTYFRLVRAERKIADGEVIILERIIDHIEYFNWKLVEES